MENKSAKYFHCGTLSRYASLIPATVHNANTTAAKQLQKTRKTESVNFTAGVPYGMEITLLKERVGHERADDPNIIANQIIRSAMR